MNFQVQRGALLETHRGQFFNPNDQVTFVHGRQKGLAQLGINQSGKQQQYASGNSHHALSAQRPGQRWRVKGEQLAWQPGIAMLDFTKQERGQHRYDGQ